MRNKKEDGVSVLRPGFCLLSGRVFEGAWSRNVTETVVGETTSQPEPSASDLAMRAATGGFSPASGLCKRLERLPEISSVG